LWYVYGISTIHRTELSKMFNVSNECAKASIVRLRETGYIQNAYLKEMLKRYRKANYILVPFIKPQSISKVKYVFDYHYYYEFTDLKANILKLNFWSDYK
jgi:hypothetical protein